MGGPSLDCRFLALPLLFAHQLFHVFCPALRRWLNLSGTADRFIKFKRHLERFVASGLCLHRYTYPFRLLLCWMLSSSSNSSATCRKHSLVHSVSRSEYRTMRFLNRSLLASCPTIQPLPRTMYSSQHFFFLIFKNFFICSLSVLAIQPAHSLSACFGTVYM